MIRFINWCSSFFKKPELVVSPIISKSGDIIKAEFKKPKYSNNILDDMPNELVDDIVSTKEQYKPVKYCGNFIDFLDDEGLLEGLIYCDDCCEENYSFHNRKPRYSRKRTRVERDDTDDEKENDEPELTGLTKKGTQYKSKAYVYGMAGERYVGKHIKCQRCGKALHQLRANFPGVDFKCKLDHYVQLKCTKKKPTYGGNMKLMCGQYEKQINAIKKPMGADFMILNYSGRRVKDIKYLKNENIRLTDLEPREKDQRVIKDKQIVGFKKFKASSLNVNTSFLENIDIPDNCDELPLNIQFRKTIRRILDENPLMPLPDYQIESFRNTVELSRPVYYTVSLEKMTCSCPRYMYNCHKEGFQCKHIIIACIRHFKMNIRSIRVADVRAGSLKRTTFYTVNLHEKTCSCSAFSFNKNCSHVDKYCK